MAHHHHHHHGEVSGKNLIITMFLNFIITLVELIGGLLSGSLSLLSDALHNLSDGVSVIISFFALKLSQRDNNNRMTFGYKRAEILAALFNSSVLVIISFYLFKGAYFKLIAPKPINGLMMIIVALIGLAANTFSVIILRDNAKKNVNIKSAYIHLLADAMSSVGVVFGGILIHFYNIYWIDPVLTILIGVYIVKESFAIINETVRILMQATPENIDVDNMKKEVEQIPLVADIHHLHVWQTNDHDIHVECHVNLEKDLKLSQVNEIRENLEKLLKHKFSVHHFTVQTEYNCCHDVGLIKKRFKKAN